MNNARINKTLEEMTAIRVASDWLNFAALVVSRGESPAKLSDIVSTKVVAQYEPNKYLDGYKFNAAANERIAKKSVYFAAQYLNNGDFPEVLAHFRNLAK
jgi:hypothetical protein